MKKKVCRILTAGILAASITGMSGLSALPVAAAQGPASFTYEKVRGGTFSFNKYLVFDKEAGVPNVTFDFKITPGEAKAADDSHVAVYSTTIMPSEGKTAVSFSPSDDNKNTRNQTNEDKNALNEKSGFDDSKQDYVKKTVALDFTDVLFDEPGVYRYNITESAEGNYAYIDNDKQTTRTLDVYVTSDPNDAKQLEVAGYVLHTGNDAPARNENSGTGDITTEGARLADKSEGFINRFDSSNLFIGKAVAGNQASRDKYFEFTVEITGAGNGTVMGVYRQDADTQLAENSATKTEYYKTDPTLAENPLDLTADKGGSVTGHFYLQGDQSIEIEGIPKGATYKVTEDAEDYTSSNGATGKFVQSDGNVSTTDVTFKDDAEGKIAEDDVKVGFTNTRSGLVPTGILLPMAPYIGLGAAAVAVGAVIVVTSKKKKKEEQ